MTRHIICEGFAGKITFETYKCIELYLKISQKSENHTKIPKYVSYSDTQFWKLGEDTTH